MESTEAREQWYAAFGVPRQPRFALQDNVRYCSLAFVEVGFPAVLLISPPFPWGGRGRRRIFLQGSENPLDMDCRSEEDLLQLKDMRKKMMMHFRSNFYRVTAMETVFVVFGKKALGFVPRRILKSNEDNEELLRGLVASFDR